MKKIIANAPCSIILSISLLLIFSIGILCLFAGESDLVNLNVKEFTLTNGMKVLILERHSSPTVAVNLVFKVGSANEQPGITGLSHIIEHMIFKGTQRIGTKDYKNEKIVLDKMEEVYEKLDALRKKRTGQLPGQPSVENQEIKSLENELDDLKKKAATYIIPDEGSMLIRSNGATNINASTGEEITQYYCELPANKLELWAWLESDRFKYPVWRGFREEKDVIMEERRMRQESNPQGILYEQFKALCYQVHPLRWLPIGWASDIESVTKKQLLEYFHQYYSPNNAIAVIVGDVETENVLALMRKYFESIPPSPQAPPPVIAVEPPQTAERRLTIELEAQPMMLIGYHTTTLAQKDDYVLDMASALLSGGRTSRLYRSLVLEKNLCLQIYCYNHVGKYPGLFVFGAMPRYPHTIEEVEKAIYEEIEKLKTEISDRELTIAKKRNSAAFLRGLDDNLGLAHMLGNYEALLSWKYISDVRARWNAVTKEEIQAAVSKYFTITNRTVVTLGFKKPANSGKKSEEKDKENQK